MRRILSCCLAGGLLLSFSGMVRADDEPKDIIAKAVKATGGEEKLTKLKAGQSKNKGTLHIMGQAIAVTQSTAVQLPDQFKEVLDLDVGGNKVTITTVYNGKEGWVNVMGQNMELKKEVLKELEEAAHMMRVMRLVALKDKMYELTPLGEVKVNDKPAVGIKVVCKGHRDLNIYFYKDSGLVGKVERRTVEAQTMKEVTEERIIPEYQDIDGMKVAKKVVIKHDGKDLMDIEVQEVKFLEKLDDSEFAKP